MSSTATRRFGTDVSNIPTDVIRKTPKKAPNVSKKQVAKTPVQSKNSPSRPLFDAMESLMETLTVCDDEITIRSPASKVKSVPMDYRYERDFLLSFKQFCTQPLEGLISIPEASADLMNSSFTSHVAEFDSFKENAAPFENLSSSVPASPSVNRAPSTSASPSKKSSPKKSKPSEQDSRRLAARQKQLDIGMNTDGYRRFMETVPLESRTKNHPRMPNIHQVCSKRSWDGQVRKWRRQLHDYDLTAAAGSDGTTAADAKASSEEEYFSESEENGEETENCVTVA